MPFECRNRERRVVRVPEWEWISKEQTLLATPLKGHSVRYSSPPFLPSLLYIISSFPSFDLFSSSPLTTFLLLQSPYFDFYLV